MACEMFFFRHPPFARIWPLSSRFKGSRVADPVATFLKLELPPPSPSPVDESISYDVRSIDVPGLARCYAIAAVPLARRRTAGHVRR